MSNRVRKLFNFRFTYGQDIASRLEVLAAKGLFLESINPYFWTFLRGDPQSLHYTVTYFSEASIFHPDMPENQQIYLDYAAEVGWHFVAQFNQMQIFCSSLENPVPFETDAREKLKNVKRCMKKSFLPSIICLFFIFSLNLSTSFSTLQRNPIDFFSDAIGLLSTTVLCLALLYFLYLLLDYFIWCKRSERSIACGGDCVEGMGRVHRCVDAVFLFCAFGGLAGMLANLAMKAHWFILLFCIAQVPIFTLCYWFCIRCLKRLKATAWTNRIVSLLVLMLVGFGYFAAMLFFIFRFDAIPMKKEEYRTVSWQLSPTESRDYKLYNDVLPLTCADVYGAIDYDYYSSEKEVNSTLFLTNKRYQQEALPAKDAPPSLSYFILEPQFSFVYNRVRKQLLTVPTWNDNTEMKQIDNALFGTTDAYQKHYGSDATGQYVLLFTDQIVILRLAEAATPEQVAVIRKALKL